MRQNINTILLLVVYNTMESSQTFSKLRYYRVLYNRANEKQTRYAKWAPSLIATWTLMGAYLNSCRLTLCFPAAEGISYSSDKENDKELLVIKSWEWFVIRLLCVYKFYALMTDFGNGSGLHYAQCLKLTPLYRKKPFLFLE